MNFITITNSTNINARFFLKSPELDNSNGKIISVLENISNSDCNNCKDFGVLPLIAPNQVHGANIITVNDDNFREYVLPNVPECDGIFLMTRNAEASLRFADCAPVLVYPDDDWAENNFWYAMLLHSGFKGTVLNIVNEGISLLKNIAGENSIKHVNGWVGPCIAQMNYERKLDDWTEKALRTFTPENVNISGVNYFFDIRGEIKTQFIKSGVLPEKIYVSDSNTFTDERCYSYRRGDKLNRMILHVKI